MQPRSPKPSRSQKPVTGESEHTSLACRMAELSVIPMSAQVVGESATVMLFSLHLRGVSKLIMILFLFYLDHVV